MELHKRQANHTTHLRTRNHLIDRSLYLFCSYVFSSRFNLSLHIFRFVSFRFILYNNTLYTYIYFSFYFMHTILTILLISIRPLLSPCIIYTSLSHFRIFFLTSLCRSTQKQINSSASVFAILCIAKNKVIGLVICVRVCVSVFMYVFKFNTFGIVLK